MTADPFFIAYTQGKIMELLSCAFLILHHFSAGFYML
jgi:hypothetical protein